MATTRGSAGAPNRFASATAAAPTGQGHGPFWLILALAAAFRFPLLLILTQGSDYWFYLSLGQLSNLGFYPYLHYWLEYPPVFPWLVVAVYRFALTFPPILTNSFDATFHLLLGGLLVAADLALIALVYLIALHLTDRRKATIRTACYAALFWPVAVATGWYDALPAALLFLGLYLLLRGRGASAGIAAGLGFMTKIFPAILVPAALKFLPTRRARAATAVASVAVTLLLAAPFLWLSPTYFLASYRATFSRSAWETVWALVEGYFSYGKVAPLGVRFDPSTAGYVVYPARLPNLPLTALFALLYAALWLKPVVRSPRNLTLFTALSTLLVLLYSKGYSPQFIAYLLPFVVLLLPRPRAIAYAALLSAVNLLEWPLYHEWLGRVPWVLAVAVIARTLLWLGLGIEWLAELWQFRNPLQAVRRRAWRIAGLALALLAIPASIVAWQMWTRAYYNGEPLRPAFDFVTSHDNGLPTAFVFADDDLYQRFAPFFGRRGDFYLFRPQYDGKITLKAATLSPEGRRDALAALAGSHGQVFLIRMADDWTSHDLNDWLDAHAHLSASLRVENVDISVWQTSFPVPRATRQP